MAERIAANAFDIRKKVYAGIRHAVTFHDEVEELVDVEEISEEDKNKPKWLFGWKEAEGRKHRRVRAVEGKKKLHCLRCGVRSLCNKVQDMRCDSGLAGREQHRPKKVTVLRKTVLRVLRSTCRVEVAAEEHHCTRRNRENGVLER